jgi:hypothetical protein
MGWRDIESVIQGDLDAEKIRLQRESLRSANINDGWWDLWERTISSWTANTEELDKKLKNSRALGLGNDLGIIKMDEYHYILQNPAFPQIKLDVKCKPGKSITVTGEKSPSASRVFAVPARRFTFDVDMNYQPYLAGETQGCFRPSQLADLLTDIVADFFRGMATG